MFFNKQGKTSLMLLFPRSNTCNDVQFERDFGIFPYNLLSLRSRVTRVEAAGNASGTGPMRLFFLRFNTRRFSFVATKHEGIVPEMLLLERSST